MTKIWFRILFTSLCKHISYYQWLLTNYPPDFVLNSPNLSFWTPHSLVGSALPLTFLIRYQNFHFLQAPIYLTLFHGIIFFLTEIPSQNPFLTAFLEHLSAVENLTDHWQTFPARSRPPHSQNPFIFRLHLSLLTF